jgi:hypothetical protein
MALLYLLDDDLAVDEQGWEWGFADGIWQPKEEQRESQRPQLRLVTPDDEAPAR